jgi:hypothetical protein
MDGKSYFGIKINQLDLIQIFCAGLCEMIYWLAFDIWWGRENELVFLKLYVRPSELCVFGNDEDGPSCKDDREEIVTVVFA